LNSEKILKIRKKSKLNSKMIWTIWKNIVKWYGKYRGKVSWIVIRYGLYGRKVSWIVKRYRKYRRKVSWKVKR
jgi:hypothetical protein